MVFKRYSNPHFFVGNLIKNHCFADGMKALFDEIEEQRLWELYCNSINTRLMAGDNRSFDEWKKGSVKKEVKTMTKSEILTAEKKSREILKSISPKKKKGGKK